MSLSTYNMLNTSATKYSTALKEKQLEADVQNVMRRVIKVEELPRTRIQVTLQVLQEPQGTPSRLNVSSSLVCRSAANS